MVTIRDIKTICTAPEGINLLVVKVVLMSLMVTIGFSP